MTWSAYALSQTPVGNGAPLAVGSDVWILTAFFSGGTQTINVVTLAGSITTYTLSTPVDPLTNATNLVTDGTNVYYQYHDNYPREWFVSVPIASPTFNTFLSDVNSNGISLSGSNTVSVGSTTGGGGTPTSIKVTTGGTFVNYGFYTPSGTLGPSVFDGTSIWTALESTSTMYQINFATQALTATYTLAGTSVNGQMGFDGTFIYLAATSGMIVFNTGTGTSSVVGSAVLGDCFYSTNFSEVFTFEPSTGDIYTAPAGGGTLTNVGNVLAITGGSSGPGITGFGDGPSSTLWAGAESNVGSFIIKYTPDQAMNSWMIL